MKSRSGVGKEQPVGWAALMGQNTGTNGTSFAKGNTLYIRDDQGNDEVR